MCGVEPRQIAANLQSPALEVVDQQNPAVCSRQKVEMRWQSWFLHGTVWKPANLGSPKPESLSPAMPAECSRTMYAVRTWK